MEIRKSNKGYGSKGIVPWEFDKYTAKYIKWR